MNNPPTPGLSFIVPIYNEAGEIAKTVNRLRTVLDSIDLSWEIILVDDGSSDGSREAVLALESDNVFSLLHPANAGYGASLKTGILCARYKWIGIVDADGTYDIERLPELVEKMRIGFDMVVARRSNISSMDKPLKRFFRQAFIRTISFLVNHKVHDPNSGFRIFRRDLAIAYMPFLCQKFSFTTSITLFALGEGLFISYVPMTYHPRQGHSKVNHLRDSMRTMQLVLQGISFTNPVKLYLILVALLIFFGLLPAWAMVAAKWTIIANLYFFTLLGSLLLFGLGVLCDALRVAITNNEPIERIGIFRTSVAESKSSEIEDRSLIAEVLSTPE